MNFPEQGQLDVNDAQPQEDEAFVLRTSFAQQRLWFIDQLAPGGAMYNIPVAVRLRGTLDAAALERALGEVVRRHEALRTTFCDEGGEPVQIVAARLAMALPIVDLNHLPEERREAEARRRASEEARRPFDLARGPLLRSCLLRLAGDDHVLLLTMHHIVSDGWSMGVLVRDLVAIYAASSGGRPSPLPEPVLQYGDYAEWQREWLRGEVLEGEIQYWKRRLAGAPTLDLPTDRPHPTVQTFRGAARSALIPGAIAGSLRALSREEGATLFMTLLSAFQVLLHRYSGQEDICVGSPIANRNRMETEGLIGFFVNTLVLRGDLSGDPPFRQLVRRAREVTLEAYAHQDLPFEMVVAALQPDRELGKNPLFQVMFMFGEGAKGASPRSLDLPGLTVSELEREGATSTFDLTLAMGEGPAGLTAVLEYSTELFDEATIDRMLGHLRNLLEGIAADPDRPISKLPLLGEEERRRILVEWNDTAAADPRAGQCIQQLFESQARLTPGATAVVFPPLEAGAPAVRLDYGELDRRANQLARHLRRLGVGPGVPVGICAERSPEMVVGVLGVLKAGGAYLPIDPAYPSERLRYILEDSRVSVLLTQSRLVAGLPQPARVVCLDGDWPAIAAERDADLECTGSPDDLAYLIYTSGSTGKPKGTMIRQRSLVNAYLGWEEAYELREVRSHLQMASFAFDVFTGDLVRALCSGGKLVLCPREHLLEPARLHALMREEGVEYAEFVPAVLRALADHLEESGQDLAFLRLLVCGSDVWRVGEYRRFLRLCGPGTRLVNSFGLTEATIDSSYFESRSLDLPEERLVPIGRPFANTRLYILDRHLQPVPAGVTGELHVGGAGVAAGYWNRPELTAERFVLDPFSAEPGARLYRTGDRARHLPTGEVEFLGRADDQVKLRGVRIETGEIEVALRQHPLVREALVVAAVPPASAGGEGAHARELRLAAYLVVDAAPDARGALSLPELRSFLKARLPEVMVPTVFAVLDTLPLTPNGKVDRKALPEPDWSCSELREPRVAPRTAVEQALASIWAELLGAEEVGVGDSFFDLGGHSLLATQLVSRVRNALGVELPLRSVFEQPVLRDMAERIEIAGRTGAASREEPIRPAPRPGGVPLSFAQQRLWFLDRLEPGTALYNVPEVVRIRSAVEVEILRGCLDEVVRRHEALRTTFGEEQGEPVQVVAPELRVPVPLVDLRHLSPDAREAEAARLAGLEMQRPFDLARGPLLRALVLRIADDDHLLVFTMHHIVSDAWSSRVFAREITACYQAFSAGRSPSLPELPVQYADFALWQRAHLKGEVLEGELSYWKEQLRGSPQLLELPTDRARPARQRFRGDYRSFELPAELALGLRSLSEREGATPFMALMAAFMVLLHRYSGQDDICVGTPIANRNRAEIENLIGFFVNTLVLRGDLSGDPGFREVLRRVREAALGAYAHQDVPFEMVVDALQPERSLSHSPIFQVMFVHQSVGAGETQTAGVPDLRLGVAKFDISLCMVEEPGKLFGAIEYDSDLFDAATVDRMAGHLRALLEAVAADPDRSISSLPLMGEEEQRRLLVEWNGAAVPLPPETTFQQRFESWAARTPEALALAFEEERLTYGELDRRANQLAHHLRGLGVGAEGLVGICAERSPAMVVAVLGVMKAGGAYLPLDPAYPPERLAFMLEDSRASVLVTQGHLVPRLPANGARIVRLDEDRESITRGPCEAPTPLAGAESLAYVIYTSGSTGRPKGALLRHRGLCNLSEAQRRAFDLAPGRRVLQFSPFSFDASVWEMAMALGNGATLWLARQETLADGEALQRLLREREIDVVTLPPSVLTVLSPEELPGLGTVISAGEACTRDLVARWAPGRRFVNAYGPTETTVCASWTVCRADDPRPPSIGRPLPNTRAYVLDAKLRPVPVGVPGELCVGGVNVARGYLDRPELTAERFVADPFTNGEKQQMYRTGDRARWRADGEIEYLGRIDQQVKLRGYRIELGEIEEVLARHPGVDEAVVVVREDGAAKRLVAYVVAAGAEGELEPRLLRESLREKLPEYMVPSAIVVLGALPLTPNGKVDRRALPAPEAQRGMEPVAPRTPEEEALAGIWGKLLGLERVGVHDNFFELGGDSILSIQIVSRAREVGLRLTPRQVFEHPTVAGLAAVAERKAAPEAEQREVWREAPPTSPPDGHSPSDFEVFGWSQEDVAEILGELDALPATDSEQERRSGGTPAAGAAGDAVEGE